MNIVIPMAGAGSRFTNAGIHTPKPLIKVKGLSLIEHSVNSFDVNGTYIFITRKNNNSYDKILSEKLISIRPESKQIQIDSVTSGAVETVLQAKDYIDNDEPLVVFNCDQLIKWNVENFLTFLYKKDPHSLVVTYTSTDPKNSFAIVEGCKVTSLVEKKPVSNTALIGFHYWKRGKDFVDSAHKLMSSFKENGIKESYISESFNFLDGDIYQYHVRNETYIPLGTPEDVQKYEEI